MCFGFTFDFQEWACGHFVFLLKNCLLWNQSEQHSFTLAHLLLILLTPDLNKVLSRSFISWFWLSSEYASVEMTNACIKSEVSGNAMGQFFEETCSVFSLLSAFKI